MIDSYVQANIAFLTLQLLAVSVRIYVRVFLVRAFGWDDVAAVFTLVLASAYDSCLIAIAGLTDLVPIPEIRPVKNIIPAIYLVLSVECLYICATAALKVALGLLLLRVLVRPWMRYLIYTVMAVSVSFSLGYFFAVLFQCGNPYNFPYKIVMGQCLSLSVINGLSYFHAVLVAACDLVYGALPVIFLWNADFNRRTKISVGGILALGSFGCICTFIRIGWIHYLTAATLTYLVTSRGIALMSTIELSIGLTCLSLATYKPLLNRLFPRDRYYYYTRDETRYTYGSDRGTPGELMVNTTVSSQHSHQSEPSPSDSCASPWAASPARCEKPLEPATALGADRTTWSSAEWKIGRAV